ncbi:MAG: dNTP triphosphohydrolase [Acidobacteria bacterium]|nr:dNTP triphosphohydrolase [Acidobacteriota bacterium]MCA1611303.1 dNTP triphosphohydrolase [Acidobacteriota bacterium]
MTTTTAPFTKEAFERLEEERLPVYASRSGRAGRPRGPAAAMPGDHRTEYARDRDRIVHSRAFRRLKHKTQVFIPYEGDHFRTRLTHTIEVSQIARSAARSLGLNEDLTEAIALGHDLGHTPFGHSGERILDRLLRESHPHAGGFKHNYQGVRVVDRLEKRYDEPGLNLTHDVREGILKHTTWKMDFPFPLEFREGLRFQSGGTLEAQLVNWSDEIAQQTHDLEDGLPLAEEEEIEALEISRAVRGERPRAGDPASRRAGLIRGMIAVLTSDLVEASRHRIERWTETEGIATPDDFVARRERLPGDLISFSDRGKRLYRELKDFVYRHVIHSFPVSRHDGHARRVVAGVFLAYRENPRLLPDSVLLSVSEELGVRFLREVSLRDVDAEIEERYRMRPEFFRAIADHIAGMTDSYCNAEYKELATGS